MKREKDPIPSVLRLRPRSRKTMKTKTTVFDLIEALNQVVDKDEEKFVPQIVSQMVNSGRLKAVRGPEGFRRTENP